MLEKKKKNPIPTRNGPTWKVTAEQLIVSNLVSSAAINSLQ